MNQSIGNESGKVNLEKYMERLGRDKIKSNYYWRAIEVGYYFFVFFCLCSSWVSHFMTVIQTYNLLHF